MSYWEYEIHTCTRLLKRLRESENGCTLTGAETLELRCFLRARMDWATERQAEHAPMTEAEQTEEALNRR